MMDTTNINSNNAKVTNKEPNPESEGNASDKPCFDEEKQSQQEIGEKKNVSLIPKRKLRKSKMSIRGTQENQQLPVLLSSPTNNRRRTFESAELSSGESEECNGFDLNDLENLGHENNILKKLLDEAEMMSNVKRRRTLTTCWKPVKNDVAFKENDSLISDADNKRKTTKTVVLNETVGESTLNSDKSLNCTALNSNRLRKNSRYRGTSPSTTTRQKVSIDTTNPAYREPFNYGWKRELVYRAVGSENQARRMADIYYYTPEGKKVRSYREVLEFLTTSELTIDNFTFFKEPLGVDDSSKEIIRDAKKAKDFSSAKVSFKSVKKNEPTVKKPLSKKGVEKNVQAVELKTTNKSTASTPETFKVKLPVKKTAHKKEAAACSPILGAGTKDDVLSSPSWNLSPSKKSQQIEKSPPTKIKRINKKKQSQPDVDQRQYFMVSVCAGYHALSRIFQYLKVQELLRAARVCRMWRDLAAHPSLWKTVRMKNSQVTDWDGLADTLKNRGTQHLDLRKMLIVGDVDIMWKKFVTAIPRVTSLTKLELCKCPAIVIEEVMKNCPQLEIINAMSIKCESLNLEYVSNISQCSELKLKAVSGMSLEGDLMPLLQLSKITYLSLTSVKDLGKKKIEVLQSLENLETLELGECSDFPDKFGTSVLSKLHKLEKLRLEKGQGSCCTFDILDGISQMKILTQLELVNFDVKNGFDKYLSSCKNIKRLLIIPTYVSQSATSNNMILGGVTELSNNLTHFVWGVTQELLRVTELFVDQCNQMNKQITGDSIPVLKPVPCLELVDEILEDKNSSQDAKQQSNLSNPQVEILPLPHLQKLLLTALPKTRVKILKIPFHATWRQSISDSTSQ